MSNALAIAASGLKTGEYLIDRLAHDVANLNTPNYKAEKTIFTDVLYQQLPGEPTLTPQAAALQSGLGAAIYSTAKDFSPGALKPGTSDYEIAINGQGFYQVLQQDGRIAYTRNSTLSIDDEHYLTTTQGLRLADNIQIPENTEKLTIQPNGIVEATLPGENQAQYLGTIQLARFANPEHLQSLGNGLYTSTNQNSVPLVDNPGNSGLGDLLQQQIESSNVDMVNSLMQLTMAQRVYQLNAKALQIADELEKLTNELRN